MLQASRAAARPAARGRMVVAAAADRPLWAPGVQPPAYLTGKLAGESWREGCRVHRGPPCRASDI